MSIPTKMSLPCFIATPPELTFTTHGNPRFHARVGVEHHRQEPDGTWTKLESTFHNLVVFDKTALHAYDKFAVGDNVIASGYIHEYDIERNGRTELREEFVARRLGHDVARTRYEVDRTRTPDHQPTAIDLPHQPTRENTRAAAAVMANDPLAPRTANPAPNPVASAEPARGLGL